MVKQKIPSAATLGHKASPGFDLKQSSIVGPSQKCLMLISFPDKESVSQHGRYRSFKGEKSVSQIMVILWIH